MKQLCNDLEQQYQEMDDLVANLKEDQWQQLTPFYGWSVFDQVSHIAYFDQEAVAAIDDPDGFKKRVDALMIVILKDLCFRNYTNSMLGIKTPEKLLSHWRETRKVLIDRLRSQSPKDRVLWYGPDMNTRSFATARLMETWSHTRDIFDTFALKQQNDEKLKHVAHIGVSTFAWSFIISGLTVPGINPRVELIGPNGDLWEWGEKGAEQWVRGNAEEFCLVVTQRRNLKDTQLKYHGENMAAWLSQAQAFAGGKQEPPLPGARVIDHTI